MKLCRFNDNQLGVVKGDVVYDVTSVLDLLPVCRYPLPQKDLLIKALGGLKAPIEAALKTAKTHVVTDVRFLSPVANPGKIIGAPINYEAHVQESKQDAGIAHGRLITSIDDWGLFLKAGSSLIGFGSEIVLRFEGRRNDHELELGVVIGSVCSQIKAQHAMQYIAGYTMALDMTLRGKEFQCFRKSIDTYSVLGPWLVTPDETADPNQLDLWLKVNGQMRQQSNTRHLVYDIARLIEFASSMYTLQPGDVVMTGTPAGVGPVEPGDVLLAGIGGIGEFPIPVASAHV